uniref:Putative secreted protein n=1 Tax=Anopheles darlingi TaxID=43151 RepID=A0A2M4D5P3_ANODA
MLRFFKERLHVYSMLFYLCRLVSCAIASSRINKQCSNTIYKCIVKVVLMRVKNGRSHSIVHRARARARAQSDLVECNRQNGCKSW